MNKQLKHVISPNVSASWFLSQPWTPFGILYSRNNITAMIFRSVILCINRTNLFLIAGSHCIQITMQENYGTKDDGLVAEGSQFSIYCKTPEIRAGYFVVWYVGLMIIQMYLATFAWLVSPSGCFCLFVSKEVSTGRARLIRSHSSARFCFELSGNRIRLYPVIRILTKTLN